MAGIVMFCGCESNEYSINAGFESVRPSIYTNINTATLMMPKAQSMKDVTVLGKAQAQGSTTCVLGIVSSGDTSLETLNRQALANYPEADAILNTEIDAKRIGFIVFSKVTVTMHGIAVKYK